MIDYIVQRLGQAVLVAVILSVVTFLLLFVAKDPARALAAPDATAAEVELLRQRYGLDGPVPLQYLRWAAAAVRGDFGKSLFSQQPVSRILPPRIVATVQLSGFAILITVLVAVPLGVIAALRRGTVADLLASALAVAGQAMPIFWFGLMLIVLFSVKLGWLPVSGRGTFRHLVLPGTTLAFSVLPLTMRLTRSAMLEVVSQDFVRTATAKGVSRAAVVWKHAARNAATPVVLALGMQFGALLGGTVVTETVFAWPGLGDLAVTSVTTADLPVVQAIVLFAAVVVVASNLLADVLVGLIDPRVRY
ncbi:MAG: ABC transporter permease [Trueperaceae bacterium]|nr:ABC transporter permease [Trueperaceae bacterium]